MEEKQISEQESLSIIQKMIQTAKKEQIDDGKGWIIWGWMLFMASVLTVLNLFFLECVWYHYTDCPVLPVHCFFIPKKNREG
jgi:hypothetical protein